MIRLLSRRARAWRYVHAAPGLACPRAMARAAILAVVWTAALAAAAQGQAQGQTAPGAAAPSLPPGQIVDAIAPVGPGNTVRDPADGMGVVTLRPDPVQMGRPLLHDRHAEGPEVDWLRARARRGFAAGMSGFVYDNRDRGHSHLRLREFPQLAATRYAPVFRDRGLDYGLAGAFRFAMPVIGNSSTARTRGAFARSQARAALDGAAMAARAFRLYETNHLYFYPEHRDHDPGTDDRFYANVPFFVVSQGSSHSERGLLRGAALALAALPPATFAAARDLGLIAPTLQMLLRSNRTDAPPYLSGAAHPTALRSRDLDLLALVQAANALRPEDIPPLVRLSVVEDFAALPGIDYPDPMAREALFTTPAGIGRAWRSLAYSREIVLSAADTADPHGRDLVFDWVILRGDPDKIAITHPPGDTARAQARITFDWHEATPVPGRPDLRTARVDIGVFARAPDMPDAPVSAPSILSVVFPVHQARRYGPGPDGALRIAEVSYAAPDRGVGFAEGYVDPALWATGNWTDRYAYPDETGLAQVTRVYGDGSTARLRQGLRGLHDAEGAPVVHQRRTGRDGRPRLTDGRP